MSGKLLPKTSTGQTSKAWGRRASGFRGLAGFTIALLKHSNFKRQNLLPSFPDMTSSPLFYHTFQVCGCFCCFVWFPISGLHTFAGDQHTIHSRLYTQAPHVMYARHDRGCSRRTRGCPKKDGPFHDKGLPDSLRKLFP